MPPRYGMIAPMGKGTRAAGAGGGGRRRSPADSDAGQATQTQRQVPGQGSRRAAAPAPAEPPAAVRPRSGRGATFSVVLMTLVALAAVGVLAAQAEATAPRVRAQASTASATKGSSKPGGSTSNSTTALPANSGSGTRIVYSPSLHRVWLAEGGTVERTMVVVPGTITPPVGSYSVYAKSPGSVGGDGVTVVDLVRFDSGSSTSFGFDAEANITGLPPAPKGSTGGVRMTQLDAQALYEFAAVGTAVVVV